MRILTTFLAILFCITTLKGQDNMVILSTGIYLLRVETTEGTVVKKFIKNK